MAKAPTKAKLLGYAKAVSGSRADFERNYDAQVALRPRGENLPFKVMAIGTAGDGAAYFAALEQARDNGWFNPLMLALTEANLFSAKNAAPPPSDADILVEFQALTAPGFGTLRPELIRRGLTRSMKQICRVVVDGGHSQGSGFLVGPQAIITCYHVVESLIAADDKAIPGSRQKLRLEFDDFGDGAKTTFGVQENWLAAFRRCRTKEKPAINGNTLFGMLAEDDNAAPELLDFAIIRVDGTPGRERGYQRLDTDRWPDMERRIFVLQLPRQLSARLDNSRTLLKWHDSGDRLRLLHDANTASGSSGGMCTNDAFEAVALHQCAMHSSDMRLIGNGAVPIARIASISETQRALEIDAKLDPLWQLPGAHAPVFGREDFQRKIWEVVEGSRRLLTISGGSRSGKSFSKYILAGMLSPAAHMLVELAAANIPANPVLLAHAVLDKVEAATPADRNLPAPEMANTTDIAWIKDVLFPPFRTRLQEAAGNRLIWIVIDDLNHHVLPDTGSRLLLEMLYQQLANLPFLRVILIGLGGAVPAADWNLTDDYLATDVQARHVETWFDRYGIDKQLTLAPGQASHLGNVAILSAKDLARARQQASDWLTDLPKVVIKTLVPPLHGAL